MPSEFLTTRFVLAIHRDLIDTFGGSPGVRDEGLLESALAQPQATAGGRLLHRTVFDQAAAYLFHVCANHPFIDGNKRAGFAAMDTFLRRNGYRLVLGDEDAYRLALGVAEGTIGKREVSSRLRRNCERSQ
ncbi:MAG: type II toxin-antitoxin system death-on-curing family toxin [Actinomycetota bacterium]